jgi:hypothetical protein
MAQSDTDVVLMDSLVEPIDIRENGKAIDRVNMYASCEFVTVLGWGNDLLRCISLEGHQIRLDEGGAWSDAAD